MNHYRSNIHIQIFEVNFNIFMLIPQFEYYKIFMICNIFIIKIKTNKLIREYKIYMYTTWIPLFIEGNKPIAMIINWNSSVNSPIYKTIFSNYKGNQRFFFVSMLVIRCYLRHLITYTDFSTDKLSMFWWWFWRISSWK